MPRLQEKDKRLLSRVFHRGIRISSKLDYFYKSKKFFFLDFGSGYVLEEPPV